MKNLCSLAVPCLLLALVGCGSSKPGPSTSGDGAADAAGSASPESGSDSAATDAAGAGTGSTAATAAPASDSGPAEAKKDADAVILEVIIAPKGDAKLSDAEKGELVKAAAEIIRTSSKLGTASSKGVTTPRKVIATLLIETPKMHKKDGLEVKIGLNGVSQEGKCPMFDLDQRVAMSDGKLDSASDVADLRKAAMASIFVKLEAATPTIKPSANCTVNKK